MYSTSPLSLVDMSLPLSLQPSSTYRSKMATRQFPKEILCACSLRICLVSLVTTSISFIYFQFQFQFYWERWKQVSDPHIKRCWYTRYNVLSISVSADLCYYVSETLPIFLQQRSKIPMEYHLLWVLWFITVISDQITNRESSPRGLSLINAYAEVHARSLDFSNE